MTCGDSTHATGAVGDVTFEHISVMGFVSLSGLSYGPGVIVAGQSFNERLSELWPEASFAICLKGSASQDIFLDFLWTAWVSKMPDEMKGKPKVLILDCGGGALIEPENYEILTELSD